MSEHIIVETQKSITRITISRPAKKNAITLEMYRTITEAFCQAEENPQVRVIFLQGTSECFTSGNDINDFLQNPPQDESSPVLAFLKTISQLKKPLVAAVNGLAIGVGATMLLHCDLVYAGAGTRLQFPFVNLGLCPEAASSLILPQVVGYHRAAELLFLAEVFTAEKALEMGLITGVFSPEKLLEESWQRAELLSSKPPKSLRTTKALLKRSNGPLIQETMMAEGKEFIPLLMGEEALEAMQAFLEKRKPDFSQF